MEQRQVKEFAEHMKQMSKSARAMLSRASIPVELRDKIMNETNYGNWSKPIIDLAGVEFELFKQIIDMYDRILQSVREEYPMMDHSWLIEIIEQFIVLLKTAPRLPSILEPLNELVGRTEYLTKSQLYVGMPRDNYREQVDAFIQRHELDTTIAAGITIFFDRVVTILSGVFDDMTDGYRWMLALNSNLDLNPNTLYTELFMWPDPIDASKTIYKSVFNMQYIFIRLHGLITKRENRQLIKNLTFKKMLELKLTKNGGGRSYNRSNKQRTYKNKHKS